MNVADGILATAIIPGLVTLFCFIAWTGAQSGSRKEQKAFRWVLIFLGVTAAFIVFLVWFQVITGITVGGGRCVYNC